MAEKIKLIHINQRPISKRKFYSVDHDYFYLFGIGNIISYKIYEASNDFVCENWRADITIDKEMKRMVDEIHCRVFPGKKVKFFGAFSYSLIRALKYEIRQNPQKVIIHFHGLHKLYYDLIILLVPGIKAVISHHGGSSFWYKRKFEDENVIKKLLHSFFEWIDKQALKRVNHIFTLTEFSRNYLINLVKPDKVSHLPVMGVDAARFKIIDKKKARAHLNLPLDKKIILQVGRGHYDRGVQYFVEAYKEMKNDPDLYFYMLAIDEKDEAYDMIKDSGIPYTGRVPWDDLYMYYNAADVLVYLPFGKMDLKYAGTSFVPLESMMCGTPVVATTLRHFPDKQIYEYCKVPEIVNEAIPMIQDLLSKDVKREELRSLVLKYYDWENVISKHLNIYKESLN